MPTPYAIVKQRFETKDKLVASVQELANDELWLPRLSSDRGGSKKLEHVSNLKLLRLHEIFTTAKQEFGSRAKLVDAVLESSKRVKDEGYRSRLEGFAVPKLYDLLRSARRRAARVKVVEAKA